MVLQSFRIRLLDSFQNFHDDGREAVGVEVYFLVVGDLADVAGKLSVMHVLVLWVGMHSVVVGIIPEHLPHIAENGREIGDDGAAEELDLFEGGHFRLFV